MLSLNLRVGLIGFRRRRSSRDRMSPVAMSNGQRRLNFTLFSCQDAVPKGNDHQIAGLRFTRRSRTCARLT
jgi:hypothetical protein